MRSSPGEFLPAMPPMGALVNGVMFNASWLAIVLSQSSLLAPVIAALHLTLHFRYFGRGPAEIALVVIVSVLGLALDQLLFLIGLFTQPGNALFAPLWLSCLWPVLATTLMHAFRGLQPYPLLAGLVGALGGSLSYLAGTRLTDIAFASVPWGLFFIGVIWAFLFPILLAGANLAESGDHRQQGD